jgi:hypothetical protein
VEGVGGIRQPAEALQHDAQRVERLRIVGPCCQSGAVGGFGVVQAAGIA